MLITRDSPVGFARLVPGDGQLLALLGEGKGTKSGGTLPGGVDCTVGSGQQRTQATIRAVTEKNPWTAGGIGIDERISQARNRIHSGLVILTRGNYGEKADGKGQLDLNSFNHR